MDFAFLFSRFCWFYGWTDSYVLKMPSRRFWMMERQIDRIRAEQDLRSLNLQVAVKPPKDQVVLDRVTSTIEKLTLEIGDKFMVRRNMFIAPEPGAAEKFKNLR